ncbi:PA14 domain-containing protein [uncultured Sphingomonas sp.]|uniref:PA14 domain-containing protein n=1 Tax=uncultured Sphingomonas sp. TaxID=158754 RepID=UPI0025DF4C20|nr:PA14 domain-containing protein [uncultured Sphingomonas sp.]
MILSVALAGPVQAAQGLNGRYFGGPSGSIDAAEDRIEEGSLAATFTATTVCFPGCGQIIGTHEHLSTFLGAGHYRDLSADPEGLVNRVLELTGFLNIATTGTYTFALGSDDGSRLYIDGNVAIDNDFGHPFGYVTTGLALAAGSHSFRLVHFDNGGGTGLSVLLNGEGLGGSFLSTEGAVPEPASWALMVGGFGMAGAALRRRRAQPLLA